MEIGKLFVFNLNINITKCKKPQFLTFYKLNLLILKEMNGWLSRISAHSHLILLLSCLFDVEMANAKIVVRSDVASF